eukprot:m.69263 g.69263  ORF g.69263 m.69263 type:complete len:668 (+) comp16768_c0_seq1:53-2056(+)
MATANFVQFAPFSSSADTTFWHALTQRKLNEYQLDDAAQPILGFFNTEERKEMPARLCVSADAFEKTPKPAAANTFLAHGTLHNTNTLDAFKAIDVNVLAEQAAEQVWRDMTSGAALTTPSLLARFVLLTFADLKKYHYYYWFAFPVIRTVEDAVLLAAPAPLASVMAPEEAATLYQAFVTLRSQQPGQNVCLYSRSAGGVVPLSSLAQLPPEEELTVVAADPSGRTDSPGWPLRNLLCLIAGHAPARETCNLICYRERGSDLSPSSVLRVKLPKLQPLEEGSKVAHFKGWEKNARGKLAPRMCDLSASMDPQRLAETSVDLNLKLMRWRLLPELDLPRIAATRCLLIGSGTLGCNVARALMGWGVRQVTFVDNSTVSFSNPVRQTLFQFEDCLDGGSPKAETAARRLAQIFPGMRTRGHTMSIPMPGHPVARDTEDACRQSVQMLEQLIEEHDAVMLLTDTRESRWLPSLICAAADKLCLTAAMGFDTFVCMRHGVRGEGGKRNVGCYFCNDVVAPTDSTKDRTLDQQCTVSRPGVSMLASAAVAELLVSTLLHPLGAGAPASTSADDPQLHASPSPLGLVPHQIRGVLRSFSNMLVSGQTFDRCTACSPAVTEAYQKMGFEFCLRAFNEPSYLADVTGLSRMCEEVDAIADLDMDWSDAEDSDDQ